MCIIYYNEYGSRYNLDEIRNGWDNNPDGVGVMWVENGKVRTIRGLIDKETTVEIAKDFDGIPHILHLRWGTHGSVCEELTHPFRVTPDDADQHVWMMHNGVIGDAELGEVPGPGESDTQVLARQLQAKAAEKGSDVFFKDAFCRHLEMKVGSYNKLIFLRDDGKVSILNTGSWYPDEKTGIWYSNRYSLLPAYKAEAAEEEEIKAHGWESLFASEEYVEYAEEHGISLEEE